MGGCGSGERWPKKRAAEACWYLDTAEFRRWGWLSSPGSHAGTATWGGAGPEPDVEIGYELQVGEDAGSVRLRYAPIGDLMPPLNYRVSLVTTPCHLGGRRWWLVCPLSQDGTACGRRVRKLFLPGWSFGCRHCYDLTYQSRQQSDARAYALARRGVDAIHPERWRTPTELWVMMKALAILKKRYARPRR